MYNIDTHHQLTAEIFNRYSDKMLVDMKSSKYSQSHRALFYNQKKIDSFLEILTTFQNEKDYYLYQAITRVVFEHFLVGHYIWTKTRVEKNDVCGEEYYMHYKVSEFFKRENYELRVEGIEKNIQKNNNIENIKIKYPEFLELEQKDLEQIHSIAKQFDVRNLLDYIVNKIPDNDFFKESHRMFLHFLREYNNLSSFIHGGPMAEDESYHDEPQIDKAKKIKENIQWSKIASRLIKEHIILLHLEERKEYLEIFEPIRSIIETNKKTHS